MTMTSFAQNVIGPHPFHRWYYYYYYYYYTRCYRCICVLHRTTTVAILDFDTISGDSLCLHLLEGCKPSPDDVLLRFLAAAPTSRAFWEEGAATAAAAVVAATPEAGGKEDWDEEEREDGLMLGRRLFPWPGCLKNARLRMPKVDAKSAKWKQWTLKFITGTNRLARSHAVHISIQSTVVWSYDMLCIL